MIIYFNITNDLNFPVQFYMFISDTEGKFLIRVWNWTQLIRGVHKDRLTLFYSDKIITVKFRNLRLQDTGTYQCGGSGRGWSHDINLKVDSGKKF